MTRLPGRGALEVCRPPGRCVETKLKNCPLSFCIWAICIECVLIGRMYFSCAVLVSCKSGSEQCVDW
jgi:hypothetical protein